MAATAKSSLGRDFGAGLSEAEVRYLMQEEFAQEAADIVWRRSKLGLRLSKPEIDALQAFKTNSGTLSPVRPGTKTRVPGQGA